MSIKKKQGNSIIGKATINNINDIDSEWNHWNGKYKISNSSVSFSGDLRKETEVGKFTLFLGSSFTSTLDPGSYSLTIEFSNSSIDYVEELKSETLVILPQSI